MKNNQDTELKQLLTKLLPEMLAIEETNPFPKTLDAALENQNRTALMLKAELYRDWREVLEHEIIIRKVKSNE